MKILLINDYATLTGGAEMLTLSLRNGLRLRGHDARCFASSAAPPDTENYADYQCLGTLSRFRTLLQVSNPWAFWKLRKVLSEFRPDVVHVTIFLTQLSLLILPLLRNIPSLYCAVWYRSICPLGTKLLPDGTNCQVPLGLSCYRNRCIPTRDWLPLMIQMHLLNRWKHIFNLTVSNSESVKQLLISEGIDVAEAVWNGVPTQSFHPHLSYPPTVVFAGRLVWEKGADVLLQAFARILHQLPEARLLIAGDGAERESLSRSIIDLNLQSHVSMLGHLAREEMESLFSQAWVQVIPSRWAEPFGLVAAEAQMRGTAVIASNSGGLAEIVQHEKTGLLVSPDEVECLANALFRILSDRSLAEAMGQAGHKRALQYFSEDTCIDRFVDLYTCLLRQVN